MAKRGIQFGQGKSASQNADAMTKRYGSTTGNGYGTGKSKPTVKVKPSLKGGNDPKAGLKVTWKF